MAWERRYKKQVGSNRVLFFYHSTFILHTMAPAEQQAPPAEKPKTKPAAAKKAKAQPAEGAFPLEVNACFAVVVVMADMTWQPLG